MYTRIDIKRFYIYLVSAESLQLLEHHHWPLHHRKHGQIQDGLNHIDILHRSFEGQFSLNLPLLKVFQILAEQKLFHLQLYHVSVRKWNKEIYSLLIWLRKYHFNQWLNRCNIQHSNELSRLKLECCQISLCIYIYIYIYVSGKRFSWDFWVIYIINEICQTDLISTFQKLYMCLFECIYISNVSKKAKLDTSKIHILKVARSKLFAKLETT